MTRKFMSLLDAMFLTIETTETPMHVAGLQIFQLPEDAPVSFVRDLITEFRAPGPFTDPWGLKLAGGPATRVAPALVPADDIDLEYHVRHSGLPAPGGERELGELVSHLHSVKLDRSRPLWTCHVIDGLENHRFAVYTKIHHALTDGVGAMRIMTEALATSPTGASCAPWQTQPPERDRRDSAGSRRFGLQPVLDAGSWLGRTGTDLGRGGVSLGRGLAGLSRFGGSEPVRVPFEAPGSTINGHVTAARRVATQQLALDRILSVGKRTDTSVNDVFLAVCSSALRRQLSETGLIPDESLIAGVPVSLRAPGETGSNAVGFVWASLCTDVADPLERLKAIHASMAATKDQLNDMTPGTRKVFTSSMMAPIVAVIMSGLGDRLRPPMNVTISNVPGPKHALYLKGAELEAMYPVSTTFQGLALNITCVTYNGQFNIGFTGARDSLPHLQHLAVYSSEALDELESALKKPKPTKPRAT